MVCFAPVEYRAELVARCAAIRVKLQEPNATPIHVMIEVIVIQREDCGPYRRHISIPATVKKEVERILASSLASLLSHLPHFLRLVPPFVELSPFFDVA